MALSASNTGVLKNLSQDLPTGATRHFLNVSDNNAATAEILVAAPGVGRKLILTHLTLGTLAAQSISILDGATTTLIGPVQLEAAGIGYVKDYKWGIELTENTAMYVDSDTDGLFHLYIEYINAPA